MSEYKIEKRKRRQNLLIVEGFHEKNKLFWLMFQCFPEVSIDMEDVWIYGTNIYLLYEDIVKEYGVDFIDYNEVELYESFDFQVTQDFQDTNHTNINGSYKFTKVFGKYLKEQYGLMDHRGETLYASWDEKAREYDELIQEYFIYPREVID